MFCVWLRNGFVTPLDYSMAPKAQQRIVKQTSKYNCRETFWICTQDPSNCNNSATRIFHHVLVKEVRDHVFKTPTCGCSMRPASLASGSRTRMTKVTDEISVERTLMCDPVLKDDINRQRLVDPSEVRQATDVD